MLSINPKISKCSSIGKFCSKQTREQKMIIFEWARCNPHRIQEFLKRMSQDLNYKKFYSKLYDGLRQIYQRVFGREAVRVPEIDEKQEENLVIQIDQELVGLEKSAKEHEIRKARINHLRRYLNLGDRVERSLWHKDLPELPSSGVKRGRERSRSRSRAERPRRILDPEVVLEPNLSQSTPEQNGFNPTPEVNGVISNPEQDGIAEILEPRDVNPDQVLEPEGLDRELVPDGEIVIKDADTPGVNDPKPVRLEKVVVSGKKKKKGRKSGSRIVCFYDDMIEARPARLSDEEYDLEMEFSEFLN